MVSVLDILYVVLAFCALVLTGVAVALGLETIRALGDLRRISQNVEHIASLVERLADIAFPGIEKAAKSADQLGLRVASLIKKGSNFLK
jgi:hypothetical protein